MKRSFSGELPPSPSQNSSLNEAPSDKDKNPHQQAAAPDGGTPTMRASSANNSPPAKPLFAIDVDPELPEREEFEPMPEHTSPNLKRQATPEREMASDSADEMSEKEDSAQEADADMPSFESSSTEESGSSESIHTLKKSIHIDLTAGTAVATMNRMTLKEFRKFLDICNKNPQLTHLKIESNFRESHDPEIAAHPEIQQSLINFFSNPHTIKVFEILGMEMLGMTIRPKLLTAIFSSESLSKLHIFNITLENASPDEGKLLLESIQKNVHLKHLQMSHLENRPTVRLVLNSFGKNTGLERLTLNSYMPAGTGESIAQLLQANTSLKRLDYLLGLDHIKKPHTEDQILKEFETILQGLQKNLSIEYLDLHIDYWGEHLPLWHKLLQTLNAKPGLKILNLHHMDEIPIEDIELLVNLITKQATLTSIDRVNIPEDGQSRKLLFDGLKSAPNPRLEHIGISGVGSSKSDSSLAASGKDFLDALTKFSSLTSLNLGYFDDFDYLLDFLKTQPNITAINLNIEDMPDEELQEKLLTTVANFSHIKHFTLDDNLTQKGTELQAFENKLNPALLLNQNIRSDATVLHAAAVMTALLLEYSKRDVHFPELNQDVMKALAEAIARHLPQKRARAIFDELALYAPTF